MRFHLILITSFITTCQCVAQPLHNWNVDFYKEGVKQSYTSIGGLNNPQFYNVDLNNDKENDLLIFDASDNSWLCLINENDKWIANENLQNNFPIIESWCIVTDYNGDEVADIFAYSNWYGQNGISVFNGEWINDTLHFAQQFFINTQWPQLLYNVGSYPNYIPVTAGDFPTITDVDSDEDIDIVTRGPGAGYFHWYKNTSIENGFGLDTLMFVLQDDCFGKVYDAGADGLRLSDDPNSCALLVQKNETIKHGNSTLKLLDVNYDGLMEMLVADGNASSISLLYNNGSLPNAHFKEINKQYPAYDIPIQLNYQPAIFEVDIDFDEDKDILISPQLNNSSNHNNILLYENLNNKDSLELQYSNSNFLNNGMLDFGTGSHPAIADVNADGLFDIVIGNYGYALEGGDRDARLILCLNIGTPTQPKFEVTDEDWLQLSRLTDWYFTPTFCDIDADGDQDLLFGTATGNIYHLQNVADLNEPMQFNEPDSAWMNLHSFDFPLGQRAVPSFFDLDKDGLFDLFLGNHRGNINFFKNTGTESEPHFNPNPNAEGNIANFGNVTTTAQGEFTGYAAPYTITLNQKNYLFVATQKLGVLLYEIETNGEEYLLIEQPNFINGNRGFDMHLALADIDNDPTYFEIITGQHRGGISLFQTDQFSKMLSTNNEQLNEFSSKNIKYYQQNQYLYILPGKLKYEIQQVKLFSISGQLLKQYNHLYSTKKIKLNIKNVNRGLCLIEFSSTTSRTFVKVFIN